jgi:hypothetical protein
MCVNQNRALLMFLHRLSTVEGFPGPTGTTIKSLTMVFEDFIDVINNNAVPINIPTSAENLLPKSDVTLRSANPVSFKYIFPLFLLWDYRPLACSDGIDNGRHNWLSFNPTIGAQ